MAAFTTIAAGISLASTVGSTGASISQAVKAKREQERAEEAAKKSIQEAKDTLSVNFYEGLGIAKEPFELQRELVDICRAPAGALQISTQNSRCVR